MWRVAALLLVLGGTALAQNSGCAPGQNTCAQCPSRSFVPQSFLQYPCTVNESADFAAVGNRLLCGSFLLGCFAQVSQLAYELKTNEAGTEYAVGIYTFDRATLTGTLLMDGGVKDGGATAGLKTSTVGGNLEGNREYLVCLATNHTAGAQRIAGCTWTAASGAGGLSYLVGGAGASETAQFDTDCTDTDNPYDCCQKGVCAGGSNDGTHCDDDTVCTGGGTCNATADTGTCTGLPATTGTLATSGAPAPLVALVR